MNKHSSGYLFLPEREVPGGGQTVPDLIWSGLVWKVLGNGIDSTQTEVPAPTLGEEVLRGQVEHMRS